MINPTEFEYESNVLKDLFNHLDKEGFDVYFPGTKTGECTSSYIVVKSDTSSKHQTFSTNVDIYSVMIYVPKMQYSTLGDIVADVEKSMKKIEPLFRPNGNKTPSYYDDDTKSHMVSIEYKNYKKML